MRCPDCADDIQPGNQRCACGGYLYHAWQGGGVLQAVSGTWRWWSEECRWQQLERPVAKQVRTMSETPVVAYTTAGASVEVSTTVTTPSQGITA